MIDSMIDAIPDASEAPDAPDAAPEETPTPPTALTIALPEGVRELTVTPETLALWLDVGEWAYRDALERLSAQHSMQSEMLDALLTGLRAFLRIVHYWLKRKPFRGWDEPPARERGADMVPVMTKYLAQMALRDTARRFSRVDVATLAMMQAALAKAREDGGTVSELLTAATGQATTGNADGSASQERAQRTGSGSSESATGERASASHRPRFRFRSRGGRSGAEGHAGA